MAIQDAEAFVRPFRDAEPTREQQLPPISRGALGVILLVCDVLLISGSAVTAFWLSDGAGPGGDFLHPATFAVFGLIGITLIRVPELKRLASFPHAVVRGLGGWTLAMLGIIVFQSLVQTPQTVATVVVWWGIGSVGILMSRFGFAWLSRQWVREGRLAKRVAVFGRAADLRPVMAWFALQPRDEVLVAGVYCDQRDCGADGTLQDLVTAVRDGRFDQVVLAFRGDAEEQLREAISVLRMLPIDLYWPLDLVCGVADAKGATHLNGRLCLHIEKKPLSDWRAYAKWAEDKILGSLLLIGAAPIMGLISIAIKVDSPGPVIFRQPRYGFNNAEVIVYKFRTMHSHLNDVSGATQTIRGDHRVTRVGRWLRRFNLDELPQLLNVVQGGLSLVGPRPHVKQMKAANRPYHVAVEDYPARHRVKPGITGWAQVNGLRGPTEDLRKAERRVEYDLYYIENWSIWFDLKILVLTLIYGFTDPNAV